MTIGIVQRRQVYGRGEGSRPAEALIYVLQNEVTQTCRASQVIVRTRVVDCSTMPNRHLRAKRLWFLFSRFGEHMFDPWLEKMDVDLAG